MNGPACGARTPECRIETLLDTLCRYKPCVAKSGDAARRSACATLEQTRLFHDGLLEAHSAGRARWVKKTIATRCVVRDVYLVGAEINVAAG